MGRVSYLFHLVLNVKFECVLEEVLGEIELRGEEEDESDVLVDRRHFGMVLAVDEFEQVARAVKQFERGGHLSSGETVMRQSHVLLDSRRSVQSHATLRQQTRLKKRDASTLKISHHI